MNPPRKTPTVVYVPRDAAALAVGADVVAGAIHAEAARRALPVQIKRTGSRGLFWLEPLVEVATPQGRIAYGPVQPEDVPDLFTAGFLSGASHPLRLGSPEALPYLQGQDRLLHARLGVIEPDRVDDYLATGGYRALEQALALEPPELVAQVQRSGLRGRGGAAFPAGIKWDTVRRAPGPTKYVVCNADEGDSGTFADRMVLEGDPFSLIEGMTIAALAVGATQGYVYLRVEYPHAYRTLTAAIELARARGYLGPDVCGSGRAFELEVRVGAGAYVCGEETAPTSAARRRRCSKASKASGVWCGPSRRCRPWPDFSAALPWCITSSPSPPCR